MLSYFLNTLHQCEKILVGFYLPNFSKLDDNILILSDPLQL